MLNVRKDFPYLERTVNGKPIVYMDSAATAQKPRQVMNRILDLYSSGLSNVHRAVNFLAEEVTQAFEAGRETVARFIGAQTREIIFTYNATQAFNIIKSALSSDRKLRILTTTLEHHSNLLPWIQHCKVEFIPWGDNGKIDMEVMVSKLAEKPDLMSIASASNFIGTLQPIQEIVAACKKAGVPVLVDASQSIAHRFYDVRELGCDYMIFSGHKIYGPGGIGVLYVRNDVIEKMEPVLLGGSMVKEVHANTYTVNDIPHRFEAGTPNIEGVIGLAAALDYFSKLGYEAVGDHEDELIQYTKQKLVDIKGLIQYGPPPGEPCAPLVSFHIKGLQPTAITKVLANRANVIVRSGFLCAQPAHDQLGIGPSVRVSLGVYNIKDEIDVMVEVLNSITRVLA
ncbi:MAG: aminotransferase class V-fold PLP-dependent enzyme [Planctomycetota bacterium]|jgi:cysteine desulfurase/selenocysteine lyase